MEAILLMFQLPFSILGSRVWERDGPEAAAEFVSDSARSYLLVAVPAWAGLSILAVPIMTVMTAAPYHEAAGIIPVVSLALLVGAIQWWYTTGATFSKKTGQLLISISAAIVVNVALNLLLVERFGYWAAAWTTLIAYGVAALVMAWLTRRAFRWRFPLASLGRSVLAAGLMSLAIWSIMGIMDMGAATLAVSVPVGIVVYGLALLILGEPQARRMFDRLTRRT